MKKQNHMITEPELWFSDARGIYIPRDFAEFLNGNEKISHDVPQEDIDILLDPDHDLYWEVWDSVMEKKFTVIETGQVLEIYQNGDLWIMPEGTINKISHFEELPGGSLELWGFFGDEHEAVIESVEDLEEYEDRFHDENDYQRAVEYFTIKEQ